MENEPELTGWPEGDGEIGFGNYLGEVTVGFPVVAMTIETSFRNFVNVLLHVLIDRKGEGSETANLCTKISEGIRGVQKPVTRRGGEN